MVRLTVAAPSGTGQLLLYPRLILFFRYATWNTHIAAKLTHDNNIFFCTRK